MTLRLAAVVLAALLPALAEAAPRQVSLLEGPWRFRAAGAAADAQRPSTDDSGWEEVRLPHTWGAGQHRAAWYRTRFTRPAGASDRRVYVGFDGVSTVADVYLNGTRLGRHTGAYTRFVFDLTPHLAPGENVLAVKVSNHRLDTADSLPSGVSKTLYWPYGGLYRKAWLLETGPDHVDPTDHAASGVFLTPSKVTAASADLEVRTRVRNTGTTARAYELRHRVDGPDGAEVLALTVPLRVAAGASGEAKVQGRIANPRRWGLGKPNLYRVVTELRVDGEVVDEVTERTGFRTFAMKPDGSFTLNGEEILIRGIGKHQETEHGLSAMTDEEIREDFRNLADLGVNMVRLAHYPHAQLAYQLADEQGLLVWAENGHSNPHQVGPTGERITREMVRQLYNHPSIVMWAVGNENAYMRVPALALLVRADDPHRLITYASNTGQRRGRRYQMLDFVAVNTYAGWYFRQAWDLEGDVQKARYVAENGGGAVVTNHMPYEKPRRVIDEFEPEEYRQLLAEAQMQIVFRKHAKTVPMYLVWILRDFGIDKYKDTWNTKGLLTYSNLPKDVYHLYKSFLKPDEPLVYITSKPWFLRSVGPRNGVKVYSNRPAIRLTVNGVDLGLKRNGNYAHDHHKDVDNVFFWRAEMKPGRNVVRAEDETGHADEAVIYLPGAAPPDPADPIRDVASSNPASPAVFVRLPAQPQWPFYSEFDATADNTFDQLPPSVRGASWIATRRLSKEEARTDLSFTVGDAPVRVMVVTNPETAGHFTAAGFAETGDTGRWRGNDLKLRPFRVLARQASAGERVLVPGTTADYVVLVAAP